MKNIKHAWPKWKYLVGLPVKYEHYLSRIRAVLIECVGVRCEDTIRGNKHLPFEVEEMKKDKKAANSVIKEKRRLG